MLLITGASGFVGQHLLAYFYYQSDGSAQAHANILPAWRSNSVDGGIQLDLTDAAAIRHLFDSYEITAIIHLAAEARTGLCQKDPELAQRGNVDATRNLLNVCAREPLPYFLYVSTDMVFRGDAAPYTEDAPTDAIAAYGQSKAQTEKLVQQYAGPWSIVRPALIYGPQTANRISSLTATLQMLRTGEGQFFTDEYRTPVYVNDLVRLFDNLVTDRRTGIFNAGGPERMSRYEYAQQVAQTWNLDTNKIKRGTIGSSPEHAWRPKDISLISNKAHELVDFTPMARALADIVNQ